jgi:hypothetical protein
MVWLISPKQSTRLLMAPRISASVHRVYTLVSCFSLPEISRTDRSWIPEVSQHKLNRVKTPLIELFWEIDITVRLDAFYVFKSEQAGMLD